MPPTLYNSKMWGDGGGRDDDDGNVNTYNTPTLKKCIRDSIVTDHQKCIVKADCKDYIYNLLNPLLPHKVLR